MEGEEEEEAPGSFSVSFFLSSTPTRRGGHPFLPATGAPTPSPPLLLLQAFL